MSNHKTAAQRYNDRMNKIWSEARATGHLDDNHLSHMKTSTKEEHCEYCNNK